MNSKADTVTDAILSRRSIRSFTSASVEEKLLREIVEIASRSPSGGNLQPWHVYVITGEVQKELIQEVSISLSKGIMSEGPEYTVYPDDEGSDLLPKKYKLRRRGVGQKMYGLLNIDRKDTAGKYRQLQRNWSFFNAPVGLFITVDKCMNQPQFADLGIFLQSVALLARERGLHTCMQESWAHWHETVKRVVEIPTDELLFCGMSIGYADANAIVNTLRTDRAKIEEIAVFKGFPPPLIRSNL